MTSETAKPAQPTSRLWGFIDERLGLDALDYNIPRHGNKLPYMLGGITFFGFVILILTGIFLTFYYDPNPANANQSVRTIMDTVPFGSFIRSIHYWTAQAVVISVILHMFRVFVTASYKRPRELNWVIGVLLLAVTLMFFFSGTILKWDEEAYQGLNENITISHYLGPLGLPLSPDLASNVPMLARVYALHIAVLPIIIGVIVLGHLFYVHRFNISPLPWKAKKGEDDKSEPRQPFMVHLKGLLTFGAISLIIIAILAVAFPAPLGPAPMTGIKDATLPLWPLLPLTSIDDMFGLWWILPAMAVPFLFLLGLPFIDMSDQLDPRKRKIVVLIVVVGVAIFLYLMVHGMLLSPGRTLVS